MRILSALVVLLIGCKVQAAIVEQTIADVYKDIKRESQLQEQGNIRQHSRTETEKHKINCFVAKLIQEYPEARLLDIYKSCFQDYMGAEHLVSDRQRVKNYLDEELNSLETNGLIDWLYEPCGIEGKYAISHSPQYRNTYHPHYRIIERTIFEKEIKPLLTH